MTFVRSLIADLVAKKLWPVAVLLAGALIAVPVAVRGEAEQPLPAPAAQAPVAGSAPIASAAPATSRGGRGPIGRNPFAQRDVAPKAPAATATGTTVQRSPLATTLGASGATVGGSTIGGPVGAPAFGDDLVPVGDGPAAPAKKRDTSSWHVDLRFGEDGALSNRTDVARLSPLPSAADPFFVFMGVLADGKTALFLVSSDAQATGDGTCLPSPEVCDRVEMQAGDTELFDVTTPDGVTKQYQLDLVRIDRRTQASGSVAAAQRSRESSEGRQLLRSAVSTGQVEVSDLSYNRDLGLVVPSGTARAAATGLFGGYRVDLRFGAPGELVKRYNLARLTPLPSVDEPSFVYLGVLGDGETALFLNPTEAAASGDAVCLPSPDECQRVQLKAGQEGTFAAPTIDGGTKEYALSVDAVTRLEAATVEQARAGRHRESPAGREILRRLITEVGTLAGDLDFRAETGTLEHAE